MWRRPVGAGQPSNAWRKLSRPGCTSLAFSRQPHTIARLLLLLQQAGVDTTGLLQLRAFTTFAVQYRYDDEPEELSLDRTDWCNRAEELIRRVQELIG